MGLFRKKENSEEKERRKEIKKLFRKLETKDPKTKSKVQNRLREIGEPVLAQIREMLKNDYWRIRKEALELLGLTEDESGQELLIQGLKDESKKVRRQAVISLGLIEKAKETGKAIEPIIQTLKNDKNPEVRAVAAEVLGPIEDPRAVDALIQALEDREQFTTTPAMARLFVGAFGDAEKIKYPSVRQVAALTLIKTRNKKAIATAVPVVLGEVWSTIDLPIKVFEHVGEPVMEPLVQALKDGDIGSQRYAAVALGEIRDKKAVEPLIHALKDEDWLFRKYVAKALGKIGDPRAVEPLIQALMDNKSDVRWEVAEALGKIGDPRAVEALTQAKEDKSWNVRQVAKYALNKIKKELEP